MATRRWLGRAQGIKQVDTVTIALTWAGADTITCTIANVDMVVTVGSLVTTSQVATTLKEAWEGETFTDTTATVSPSGGGQVIPMFREFTATVSGSVVTLTAKTAGKPITLSVTESTAGDGTATEATSTTATGPNFWNNADNWSGNTVPVDGDEVVFDEGSVSCLYSLTTAIQPATIKIKAGYTGYIGLAETNVDDASYPYAEYRTPLYLTFDDDVGTSLTTCVIGEGSGSGSRRIKLDAGAGEWDITVYQTGSRLQTDVPPFLFLGTDSTNIMRIERGDVGVAIREGESATLATLQVSYTSSKTTDAKCLCGDGVTLTTVDITGGETTLQSNTTSIDVAGGSLVLVAGTHTDVDIYKGATVRAIAGTITTAKLVGILTRGGSSQTLTITNELQIYSGAEFSDPNGTTVLSAGFQTYFCTLQDVTLNFGADRSYTVS